MRILSLSYCYPNAVKPNWGVFIAQRLSALSKVKNIELEVCAPVPRFPIITHLKEKIPPKEEENRGLTVYHPRYFYIPKYMKHLDGKLYAHGLLPWVRDYCKRKSPNVFDAHFAWPDGVGAYHLSKKLGIPYIITLRGWIWVGMKEPNLWSQAKEALKNARAVICLCESMVDICRDIGCDNDRLTTIHNGLDKSLFFPVNKEMARTQLGLPTDKRIVICVAYFQKRKGILETVRALAALPDGVCLVLVGAPTEKMYYREVLSVIEKLHLTDRVIVTGPKPYSLIPLLLNAADVSVLPSYWEGSPNAVIESLGCGTPVIATPVGSVPEQVIPGENGYIIPKKDVESLADAIKAALSREWDRHQLSETVMSWEDVATKVYSVINEAVGCN